MARLSPGLPGLRPARRNAVVAESSDVAGTGTDVVGGRGDVAARQRSTPRTFHRRRWRAERGRSVVDRRRSAPERRRSTVQRRPRTRDRRPSAVQRRRSAASGRPFEAENLCFLPKRPFRTGKRPPRPQGLVIFSHLTVPPAGNGFAKVPVEMVDCPHAPWS
jgi:hypothetical protein